MEAPIKTVSPNMQIRAKLRQLLSLTGTNTDRIKNGYNDFVMSFDNDENGKAAAIGFLNSLKPGRFIDKDSLKKTEEIINNPTIPSRALSQYLDILADDNTILIRFNHHNTYNAVNAGLKVSIDSIKKDIKERKKKEIKERNELEKMWTESFPPLQQTFTSPQNIVSDYLERKIKTAISPMLTKRVVDVKAHKLGDSVYAFTATVNHNQKTDSENINKLIAELSNVLNNKGKVQKLPDNNDKMIGLSVTGDPNTLLHRIKAKDPNNLILEPELPHSR